MKHRTGFTALEFVFIIAAVAFVTGITVSKWNGIQTKAKANACKGALKGLRAGVGLYQMNEASATGYAPFPTLAQLTTPGVVLKGSVPVNPYQSAADAPDSIVEGTTPGETVGARGGWVYCRETGEIWANTSVIGENEF